MADDFLQPQPQQGEIVQQQALLHEAPISGAPMPTQTPSAQPAAPAASPQLPVPGYMPVQPAAVDPNAGPANEAYYLNVAKTWAKLARAPHASPLTKEMATRSRQYLNAIRKGRV